MIFIDNLWFLMKIKLRSWYFADSKPASMKNIWFYIKFINFSAQFGWWTQNQQILVRYFRLCTFIVNFGPAGGSNLAVWAANASRHEYIRRVQEPRLVGALVFGFTKCNFQNRIFWMYPGNPYPNSLGIYSKIFQAKTEIFLLFDYLDES